MPLAAAQRGYPELTFLSATRQRLNQAGPPVRYNLLAVPVAEQEMIISKSLQKTLTGNRSADAVKKSLTALKEEQKAVEQQIKEPHGRPRHPSRRSTERII